jgi:hypothetical protein
MPIFALDMNAPTFQAPVASGSPLMFHRLFALFCLLAAPPRIMNTTRLQIHRKARQSNPAAEMGGVGL